jgi:hypothetical protein
VTRTKRTTTSKKRTAPAPAWRPRQLTILGRRYRVQYAETPMKTGRGVDEVEGLVNKVDHEIRVCVGTAEKPRQECDVVDTIIHEVLHVLIGECKCMASALAEGSEEPFVHELATLLADTLRRNRLLAEGN